MDIFDNIKNGVYVVDTNIKLVAFFICECSKKFPVKNSPMLSTPNFCPDCGRPVRPQVDSLAQANKKLREEISTREYEARERFKKDLFEYYGISNNPKKDKAWSYAWDHGHSSGFYEVAQVMGEIVDLIE